MYFSCTFHVISGSSLASQNFDTAPRVEDPKAWQCQRGAEPTAQGQVKLLEAVADGAELWQATSCET